MDFGFGAFFEKFEAAYGKKWTSFLLGLIGLTVATTCVSLVFSTALVPVLKFVKADLTNANGFVTVANGLLLFILVISGASLASYLIDAYRAKMSNAAAQEVLNRAEDILVETRANRADARAYKDEAKLLFAEVAESSIKVVEVMTALKLVTDEVAASAVSSGAVTQEQINDLMAEEIDELAGFRSRFDEILTRVSVGDDRPTNV